MSEYRDYKSPEYKKLRLACYKRDRFKCQFPGCNQVDKVLNCHHLKPWGSYPALRFVLDNTITLCKTHHQFVTGKEQEYEAIFMQAVARNGGGKMLNDSFSILMQRRRRDKDESEK